MSEQPTQYVEYSLGFEVKDQGRNVQWDKCNVTANVGLLYRGLPDCIETVFSV